MRRTAFIYFLCAFLLLWATAWGQSDSAAKSQNDSAIKPADEPIPEVLAQAVLAFRAGDFDSAIRKYKDILTRDPKFAEAYAGLAHVYLKQENIAEALENANKGIQQNPDSIAAHVAL